MKKIVITGPECSGKTCLAGSLASHFGGIYVPELSRPYLTIKSERYKYEDLNLLAQGQLALVTAVSGLEASLIVMDTSMLVLKIWSQYRFGRVDPFIQQSFDDSHYDAFLLCQPIAGWELDPLRENANDRWSLFFLYQKELVKKSKTYFVIDGSKQERLAESIKLLEVILSI